MKGVITTMGFDANYFKPGSAWYVEMKDDEEYPHRIEKFNGIVSRCQMHELQFVTGGQGGGASFRTIRIGQMADVIEMVPLIQNRVFDVGGVTA